MAKKLDLEKYSKKTKESKEPKEKRSVGRPTKYEPKYAKMLVEFFQVEPTYEVEVQYTNKKGETWTKTEQKANFLPTFERFAFNIGVDDKTLERWSKAKRSSAKRSSGSPKYPEFCLAYAYAKQLQKDILVQNGLTGGYNSQFAMFVAKNATDMREKVEVPVDDKGNPVPFVSGFNFVRPKDDGKNDNNSND